MSAKRARSRKPSPAAPRVRLPSRDRVDDYPRRRTGPRRDRGRLPPEEGGDGPGASGAVPTTDPVLSTAPPEPVTAPVALAGTPEMTGEIALLDEVRHRFSWIGSPCQSLTSRAVASPFSASGAPETQPERWVHRLRERADVDHPASAVEALHGSSGRSVRNSESSRPTMRRRGARSRRSARGGDGDSSVPRETAQGVT